MQLTNSDHPPLRSLQYLLCFCFPATVNKHDKAIKHKSAANTNTLLILLNAFLTVCFSQRLVSFIVYHTYTDIHNDYLQTQINNQEVSQVLALTVGNSDSEHSFF